MAVLFPTGAPQPVRGNPDRHEGGSTRFVADSPVEGDGFEPSVPREDEPRKCAVDPLTTADNQAPHHDGGRRIRTPRSSATGSSVLRGIGAAEWTPRLSPAF